MTCYLSTWVFFVLMLTCCLCNDKVIYKRNQGVCEEKTRGPTRDCRWVAGLYRYVDFEILKGQIIAYKIKWSTKGWTDWIVPGVNDADSKFNPSARTCSLPYEAKSMRRMWSYFYDHRHKYIICKN
ncbi:hypothetical protein FSP39_012493 [Pinctada imbricata]|uniref:Uncharacterized protein n=1 Tax=Pinctada imbricata TaxID=66713 RepID=A0AA88XNF3_PINIB|nr:hypothetical protein FSP39_012493 [Pinctada imbricata]